MTITNHTSLAIVIALALGATAAPAYARPFDINSQGSFVPAGRAGVPAQHQAADPSLSAATVHYTGDGGFDWGDAGIGAAGGLALSMVGAGGALALSQRRARRATA